MAKADDKVCNQTDTKVSGTNIYLFPTETMVLNMTYLNTIIPKITDYYVSRWALNLPHLLKRDFTTNEDHVSDIFAQQEKLHYKSSVSLLSIPGCKGSLEK